MTNTIWYALAALTEIFGCYAFWLWLREGRAPLWAFLGVASLIVFGLSLTRIETTHAGRAYAAYGGVYIAASVLWLFAVEHVRPTTRDWVGAAVAVAGAAIILSGRQ